MADFNAKDAPLDLLQSQLDDLLESYLNLVDKYQNARQHLSDQLSIGFIRLAKANYSSTNNRPYGKDYYDERMRARRIVNFEHNGESKHHGLDIQIVDVLGAEEDAVQDIDKAVCHTDALSPVPIPKGDGHEFKQRESTIEQNKPLDPLRWFGLLVPTALREAQSSFINTVKWPVPELVNIVTDMKIMESEINRIRKTIKKRR